MEMDSIGVATRGRLIGDAFDEQDSENPAWHIRPGPASPASRRDTRVVSFNHIWSKMVAKGTTLKLM